MTTPPVKHGSFSIERAFRAAPARVFAAWADSELKARWFGGPDETWKLVKRELDFRVGGSELLHGAFSHGAVSIFNARYHVIVPNERLVYAYDMFVNGKHLSVSLATAEFTVTREGGTRMLFTEQAAFLNGEYDLRSREEGSAALLDRLVVSVEEPCELVTTRVFRAPRARVFNAFSDPEQLARWWGPEGFTNEFRQFELRPGGSWRFTMRASDGTEFDNMSEFLEVNAPERVVFRHLLPMHEFRMSLSFVELDAEQTLLIWCMKFNSREDVDSIRTFLDQANEQNLDRLEAHLAEMH